MEADKWMKTRKRARRALQDTENASEQSLFSFQNMPIIIDAFTSYLNLNNVMHTTPNHNFSCPCRCLQTLRASRRAACTHRSSNACG